MNFQQKLSYSHYTSLPSTNDQARESLLTIPQGHAHVISTNEQTQGRGQRGNTWQSNPGENLTFSLAIHLAIPAQEHFEVNKAICIALVQYMREQNIQAKIKWPNDIYVGNEKIAGVLIENVIRGEMLQYSIIGIGLNLNQSHFDVPNGRPTSVHLQTQRISEPSSHLKKCTTLLYKSLKTLPNTKLHQQYLDNMYRYGQVHNYRLPSGEEFQGTIVGVDKNGILLVNTTNAGLKKFALKEIEYIFVETQKP
jgi:BirA family biotin operon repressor/biotin-[acetyl-CoA-carboxylase] ligase